MKKSNITEKILVKIMSPVLALSLLGSAPVLAQEFNASNAEEGIEPQSQTYTVNKKVVFDANCTLTFYANVDMNTGKIISYGVYTNNPKYYATVLSASLAANKLSVTITCKVEINRGYVPYDYIGNVTETVNSAGSM